MRFQNDKLKIFWGGCESSENKNDEDNLAQIKMHWTVQKKDLTIQYLMITDL